MPDEPPTTDILLKAEFDRDALVKYHWTGLIPIALTIVLLPFAMIAAVIYKIFLDRIIANWAAELTPRSLIVRKGVFNKIEKTIPLEKITDLSSSQGPIMRLFDLKQLGVETAGQSGAAGASLVSLIGIVNTDEFRRKVLAQRDLITVGESRSKGAGESPDDRVGSAELATISETLLRIEAHLEILAARDDDAST